MSVQPSTGSQAAATEHSTGLLDKIVAESRVANQTLSMQGPKTWSLSLFHKSWMAP